MIINGIIIRKSAYPHFALYKKWELMQDDATSLNFWYVSAGTVPFWQMSDNATRMSDAPRAFCIPSGPVRILFAEPSWKTMVADISQKQPASESDSLQENAEWL